MCEKNTKTATNNDFCDLNVGFVETELNKYWVGYNKLKYGMKIHFHKLTLNPMVNLHKLKLINVEYVLFLLKDKNNKIIGYTRSLIISKKADIRLHDFTNENFCMDCFYLGQDMSNFATALLDTKITAIKSSNVNSKYDDIAIGNISDYFDRGVLFYLESWEIHPKSQRKGYGDILLSETLSYLDDNYSRNRRLVFDSTPLNYDEGKLTFLTNKDLNLFKSKKEEMSTLLARLIKTHYKGTDNVGMDDVVEINKCSWE